MAMTGSYDYYLVALSVLISMFAAYAALDLAGRVTAADGWTRPAWLIGGAVAMGCGIWSMHYIGMLAFKMPMQVGYDWRIVLLSLLAAIMASAVALYVVSRQEVRSVHFVLGGIIMGLGIAAMHYIGMAAMRLPGDWRADARLVTSSVVLAVVISYGALRGAFHFREEGKRPARTKIASAIALGAAIPVIHYTGMAAVSFTPSTITPDLSRSVSISSLGTTGIAAVTFIILGVAVMTSWVDRRFAAQALELHKSDERYRQLFERSLAGVYRITADGQILDCNDACCRILGYASRVDFFSHAKRDRYLWSANSQDFLSTLLDRKVVTNFEHCLRQTNNGPVWVLENAALCADDDDELPIIEGTLIDITDLKEAEMDLRQAHLQLQKRQQEIEEELLLAERVQQSLAPKSLMWGGGSVVTFYQPAKMIGGDFGLITPRADYLSIMLCDVSGHGIGSALVANRIYTEAMGQIQLGAELAPMLRHLNEFVLRNLAGDNFYFTLAAMRLKNEGRSLEFAGAGHPPAILVRPGEHPRLLESQSVALGLVENAVGARPTTEIPLQAGDRVVIYTDGFTESFNSKSDMLGVEGLSEIVWEASLWPLPEMKRHIVDHVSAFRSGPPADDMSLVVVDMH
jgi:PAS domain S-box-containing protein